MKGHKGHHHERHHKYGGGGAFAQETPHTGEKEWEGDIKDKVDRRNHAPVIEDEAEKRKAGGRAKRKAGGMVKHHEAGKHLGHAKHVGLVAHGAEAHHHAGRKPRKAGGRAGSNANPLSSAHNGVLPPHHKDANID